MTMRRDYSVYLVTGRELLPPGMDYYRSLEQALEGGVTMVQIREKSIDNAEFLSIATKSLEICDRFGVAMLVNDHIDVALALPSRVGVHLGQSDFPVATARELLGPSRLLGISVHSVDQAQAALESGADYAGVGPVYGTQSKAGITEEQVLGPRKAAEVIAALRKEDGTRMPSVLIGGMNQTTCARALVGATSERNAPDGIAVISAIVARHDPREASRELVAIVRDYTAGLKATMGASDGLSRSAFSTATTMTNASLLDDVIAIGQKVRNTPPRVIQTLTSHVSSTFSANVALALSSSPIMSHQEAEADDLSRVTGAVVLNIGTIAEDARRGMRAVGRASNARKKPVVLDPVGVGASSFRRNVVEEILNHTQITLLKGNAAELGAIAGLSDVSSRGVDAGEGSLKDPRGLVRELARREKCLVLLSGKEDLLSNGQWTVSCSNGDPMLGRVTGTGCALGVAVAIGLAVACDPSWKIASDLPESLSRTIVDASPHLLFAGALWGLLAMTLASESGAARDDVRGPGTFIPALLDELANLSTDRIRSGAKISVGPA